MRLQEDAIIAQVRALLPGGVELDDDCGALPPTPPGHRLLVTTDLMESGQHFRLDWHPPELLGRKLLMVNLSDLDASGAAPLGFTLTLALGRDLDPAWLEAFLKGLAGAAVETGVPVIGGDTVALPAGAPRMLSLTALGEVPEGQRVPSRAGARPGDRLTLQARITRKNGPFFFTEGQTLVDGQLIAQGEFSFALLSNNQAVET